MSFYERAKEIIERDLESELNEDGMVAVAYSGIPVLVQVNKESNSVNLYARLGQLDPRDDEAGNVALELLEAQSLPDLRLWGSVCLRF